MLSNVAYHYSKANPPIVSLRGKGLRDYDVKKMLASKGFKWVFRNGRRRVMAWQAEMSVHALIEILLAIQKRGCSVIPSQSLSKDRWLYLDIPEKIVTTEIRPLQEYGFNKLINWLTENGYTRLNTVEQPGDIAVVGDSIFVWTRDCDALFRYVFDGDIVESIAKIDPQTMNAESLLSAIISNVPVRSTIAKKKKYIRKIDIPGEITLSPPKTESVENSTIRKIQQVSDMSNLSPVEEHDPSRKYSSSQARQLMERLQLTNHPLRNMIKW